MTQKQTELVPGMEVVIYDRPNGDRFGKVARVLKRFVELEDGSRWSKDGFCSPYPREEWPQRHIAPVADLSTEARDDVERAVLIRKVRFHDWTKTALGDLREVLRLVKK